MTEAARIVDVDESAVETVTAEIAASPQQNKFMGWRDAVVTPVVMTSILALSGAVTWFAASLATLGLFSKVLVFFAANTAITMAVVRLIARAFLRRPGVFSYRRHSSTCYAWNLASFLSITFLWFGISTGLLPPPLRQVFYSLLGAEIGPGIVSIGGRLTEPWLVSIGEAAMIGDGALLTPHIVTPQYGVALGKITVSRGAVIGAHAVVMAGSTVGEGAMVNAMSLVPMNTKIGAYEIWGGNPAKKLGDARSR